MSVRVELIEIRLAIPSAPQGFSVDDNGPDPNDRSASAISGYRLVQL